MHSRGTRDDYTDPGFGADAPFDAEYDSRGPSNGLNNVRRPVPGRITERDERWESGHFRDGDAEVFGLEEGRDPTIRFGARNGYDLRQPARRTDIDGYGYNRGPGRGGPFRPAQASGDGVAGRGRGVRDTWSKAEEEECDWEDMSPRLRPPAAARDELREIVSQDDWYPNDAARNISAGEGGRLKRSSQEAGFTDNSSFRRNGPRRPIDQTYPPDDRRFKVIFFALKFVGMWHGFRSFASILLTEVPMN